MDDAEVTAGHGVSFPAGPDGRRSTTALGRAVVASALAEVDPVGAAAAAGETAWRSGYVAHFRRLVEAGLPSTDDWVGIARRGLAAVHERMVVIGTEGDIPVRALLSAAPGRSFGTVAVRGTREPAARFELPYRGERLRGDAVRRQVERWVERGIAEPSLIGAIDDVLAHPEWLRLDGHTVAVLGAGAELGPLRALLRWGATVAAVDLPRPAVWQRLLATAREQAGTLLVPVADGDDTSDRELERRAGADLLADVPALADWLADAPGRLVLGNYTYADGGTHVRVSAAADVLATRLLVERGDVALAFLATPTDVFVVPREAVEQSNRAYAERSRTAKLAGRPLRALSRGRLLHRAYLPDADPGICDALVPVQGPSYALAKRLQRWRAAVARAEGVPVSLHVAPSTRTRSVVKNRALAAAFAGAHRFGVEVFEPATANTLMAALLVRDLHCGAPSGSSRHPWQDEAYAAVHGGLWRTAYAPRSALGLAAMLGWTAARG